MSFTHVESGLSARVDGKFLKNEGRRFRIKGVSYGTFAPDSNGCQFPILARVREDFQAMTRVGINTVRTYTVPRLDFLDEAATAGLSVIVGIPWMQHVAFLDDRARTQSIRHEIVNDVSTIAEHPATLLVALGNEIPPGVVRWHGASRIETFLRNVYDDTKAVAPDVLLTYVNYPPTEYLDLPFFDVCAFNVYLHRESDLRAYVAHLQVVAGNRPLLLTEIGADSLSEGESGQADLAVMQVKTVFEEGACGVVVFSWTDDWWRGGQPVNDWRFGLTTVDRQPKPALLGVSREYDDVGFSQQDQAAWPRVSVLVCAHNAADTVGECLESLLSLDYPNYEIIVINDGSSDATGSVARQHRDVLVIDTDHIGLSAARNLALTHATGTIVAYTDADVRVDPEWLVYLIQPFLRSDAVGSGGPNVVPRDDPWVAQCVARAPGSPTHILIDDRLAEHVPGCNMAFRRDALVAIGGFNESFHAAGDDVDVCWRLQANGGRIEFASSALVWHRHRSTVKAFWRQQVGYGQAETWLMDVHPERFLDGQALWKGRIYSPLPFMHAISRIQVNAGAWGTAAFPTVYSAQVPSLTSLPHLMPWQMVSAALAVVGVGCLVAGQIRVAGFTLCAAGIGFAVTVSRCLVYGWRTDVHLLPKIGGAERLSVFRYRLMISWLHLAQPIARAWGRFLGHLWSPVTADRREGFAAPARKATYSLSWPTILPLLTRRLTVEDFWSERWIDRVMLLNEMSQRLQFHSVTGSVHAHDPWQLDRDVSVSTGIFGWVDLRTLLEEHDGGRCLFRVATRHRLTPWGVLALTGCGIGGIVLVAMGQAAGLLTWCGVSTLVIASVWQRAVRVHAGIRAVVAQVATEYGLLPINSRKISGSSADAEPSSEAVRPSDATTTTEK
ncbi:MAG: glycosyltransferase [Vicinamibacterales bacterium]